MQPAKTCETSKAVNQTLPVKKSRAVFDRLYAQMDEETAKNQALLQDLEEALAATAPKK